MTDDTDLKSGANERDSAGDRSTERGDHTTPRDSGGERELSGGRRDRSREMLREELERNLDDATRRTGGKRRDWEPADRPARQAKEAAAEPGSAGGTGTTDTGGAAIDTSSPPARLTKEQKEKWPGLDKYWQGVIQKIDTDSQRGHDEEKQKRAAEDAAWAPHEATIRAFGKSRAESLAAMFGWFQGLSTRPDECFPALLRSFNYPAERLFQVMGLGGAQQANNNGAQQQAFDPRQLLQYVNQRIGSLAEQQSMERCNAVLAEFAKGRPHFEQVRTKMAAFLAPDAQGRSIVPLTPDGSIDLQTAYDMAVRADPTLGEQLITERMAAKEKKQREQAERARRAGASLGGAAPGGNFNEPKKKRGSTSVRNSISAAMAEIAER